jgi:hypothetical protein
MSLLHMIMMTRMTLPVVPNVKGNTNNGTWYFLKNSTSYYSTYLWSMSCKCSLYFCSLHNTMYYPLSTDLSLTPPRRVPALRSVCHISAPFHCTLSVCYGPHTIAILPASDSHTVAGYRTDTVRTVLAMLSINLYIQSSAYYTSDRACPVH